MGDKFLLMKEKRIGAVKTQTTESDELTKMVTDVDRRCCKTSAGAKVKDLTNNFKEFPKCQGIQGPKHSNRETIGQIT